MPVPIWLLEFREEHGRDPKPFELSEKQRLHLNRCIRESRDSYPSHVIASFEAIVGLRDADPAPGPDPDMVFEELRKEFVHYRPLMSAHFQWLRENEPLRLNQTVREIQGKIRRLMGMPSKPSEKNPKSMQSAQAVLDGLFDIVLVRKEGK